MSKSEETRIGLEEIRDEVIQKAFPELLNEDVRIGHKDLKDALFRCGELNPEGFYIEVDSSLKDAPRDVKEGGISHDLAHFVTGKEFVPRKSLLDRIAYWISPAYRRLDKRDTSLDERNTDLMAIIRGYGKQLLAFMKYSEEKGFSYYKEDGLSIRELEIILSLSK